MGEAVASGMNKGLMEKVAKTEAELRGVDKKEEVRNRVSFIGWVIELLLK